MTRSLIGAVTACATLLVLAAGATQPANASYLGYGNGDPGGWDLWTEQAGGPAQFKAEEARENRWETSHIHHVRVKEHVHHARRPHDSFEGKGY